MRKTAGRRCSRSSRRTAWPEAACARPSPRGDGPSFSTRPLRAAVSFQARPLRSDAHHRHDRDARGDPRGRGDQHRARRAARVPPLRGPRPSHGQLLDRRAAGDRVPAPDPRSDRVAGAGASPVRRDARGHPRLLLPREGRGVPAQPSLRRRRPSPCARARRARGGPGRRVRAGRQRRPQLLRRHRDRRRVPREPVGGRRGDAVDPRARGAAQDRRLHRADQRARVEATCDRVRVAVEFRDRRRRPRRSAVPRVARGPGAVRARDRRGQLPLHRAVGPGPADASRRPARTTGARRGVAGRADRRGRRWSSSSCAC